jgi:hypothetical protein
MYVAVERNPSVVLYHCKVDLHQRASSYIKILGAGEMVLATTSFRIPLTLSSNGTGKHFHG